MYLDGGYKEAQALIERLFAQVDIKPDMQAVGKDPKTELQEWLQGRKLALPKYTVVGTSGAAHRQQFEVSCEVTELRQTQQGSGALSAVVRSKSKKKRKKRASLLRTQQGSWRSKPRMRSAVRKRRPRRWCDRGS